jgi:transcriptional regulator with XRE-family HTH domain
MSDEREQFSRRLAEAMQAAGYEPQPGVLHKLFNSRYSGRSVSFQTVSRWLRGAALPEQDKLQVLAAVLGAEPHVLRFGAAAKSRVGEGASSWAGAGARERQVIEAFLALPPKRREVVAALVKALAGEL